MLPPEHSEIADRLHDAHERLKALAELVRIDEGRARIGVLESRMSEPSFWDNPDKAQGVIQELKGLRALVMPLEVLLRSTGDSVELARMAVADEDAASLVELATECERIETELDALELHTTLNEKHDANNAYLSIHPGEGGTESCDWAAILARMYERFCEHQDWDVKLVDRQEGEEAGIKSVTYHVKGDMAYGYLRSEIGVHRLVRKSPFDARNRRHTSFASVDVIPEMPEADKEIEVNESDLRIDTYRAGGAGGQHVNVTDSAVRITHIPSGIVVQCQNERSQHANRAMAMKVLKTRLALEKEREREEELQALYGEKSDSGFGSQIRNYVLDPYTLAKDRRTAHETGNVHAVLDGELLPFIESYLRWKRQKAASGAAPAKGESKGRGKNQGKSRSGDDASGSQDDDES